MDVDFFLNLYFCVLNKNKCFTSPHSFFSIKKDNIMKIQAIGMGPCPLYFVYQ